jgi:hypothetical protein
MDFHDGPGNTRFARTAIPVLVQIVPNVTAYAHRQQLALL